MRSIALGFKNATEFAQNTAQTAQLDSSNTLSVIIADMIQVLLGFVGILFFLYALYAGYVWMTSGGDPDKIKKAKGLLLNSAIGVLIVMMAYSITFFIARTIERAIP